jgi:CHAT domain-containing protein
MASRRAPCHKWADRVVHSGPDYSEPVIADANVLQRLESFIPLAPLLTPPDAATPQDDGLLTASEVSQTKLDANLVVLSACRTGAGGSEGAEALSGLAKVFFDAGSRALLVTHWEINSHAAVKLTTGAFNAMENNPRLSQAEAMRTAMAALVSDQSIDLASRPATWAAFALAGDGGRR